MEAILYFNLVISPFFGHDLQKMKKIVLSGWLDYGITELVLWDSWDISAYIRTGTLVYAFTLRIDLIHSRLCTNVIA